jgi:hypothetical protein
MEAATTSYTNFKKLASQQKTIQMKMRLSGKLHEGR